MIRKITLIATFIILIATSNSYSQFANSVSIGVEGGVSVSNAHLWPNRAEDSFYKVGYLVGMIYDVNYTSKVTFRTGLRYMTKGYRNNLPDTLGGYENEITLYYLEAPIMVKYNFPGKSLTPYLLGGGYFGINLSANTVLTSGPDTKERNLDSSFNSFDCGLVMGAGLDIKMSKKTDFFLQAAYELGLNNINDNPYTTILHNVYPDAKYNTIKNYTFLLTGGIKFDL